MITPLSVAEQTWGVHPAWWPVPPTRRPHWWQRKARHNLVELERVFGPLSDVGLAAWHRERAKGQSVFEDAGGYLLRCYSAMVGWDIKPPTTYMEAYEDALA